MIRIDVFVVLARKRRYAGRSIAACASYVKFWRHRT
jgi:hypothetical protein